MRVAERRRRSNSAVFEQSGQRMNHGNLKLSGARRGRMPGSRDANMLLPAPERSSPLCLRRRLRARLADSLSLDIAEIIKGCTRFADGFSL